MFRDKDGMVAISPTALDQIFDAQWEGILQAPEESNPAARVASEVKEPPLTGNMVHKVTMASAAVKGGLDYIHHRRPICFRGSPVSV